MSMFACCSTLLFRRKKKTKVILNPANGNNKGSNNGDFRVKPIDLIIPSTEINIKDHFFTSQKEDKRVSIIPKVLSNDSLGRSESTGDAAYEGGDEQDDREYSDLDLQPKEKLTSHGSKNELNNYVFKKEEIEARIESGHVSDPGVKNTSFFESTMLKRSCSNIETKQAKKWMNSPKKSSFCRSPMSLKSSCSADHVMLKRRSSSQVLPSRSRKIWWKLFLWSHRNLHKPNAPQRQIFSVPSVSKQKEGYSSDTHEPGQKNDKDKSKVVETENQWVAFSLGSSHMDRVTAWVKSLEDCSFVPDNVEDNCEEMESEQIADSHHLKIKETSEKGCSHSFCREGEDLAQANSIIQSLNSFSSVAHISGIGLKVVPSISSFVFLRTVNLSGNSIVYITPGSLPKSLHTLDLSRNKISTIEGLRELERLRILNLSYNRITRIGHGLSSCTVIRELYLAGNKISNLEGLHRLLKLTVLDLSFNKITTSKALGQLVANYNSLLALNLLGNPIQTNIGEDQLKKAVLSLLPHVTYLNKQLIKPHRVREVVTKSVAKAALGDVARSNRRKLMRRLSQSSSSSSRSRVGEGSCRIIKYGKNRHSSSGRK